MTRDCRPSWRGAVAVALFTSSCASGATTPAAVRTPAGGTIVFASTRHDSTSDPWASTEIYAMDGDGGNVRRLTQVAGSDAFPKLSPDGRRIVFESNRLVPEGMPRNVTDLFVMNADGSGQTRLVRGASASWAPDGRTIAFHASASGTGRPIKRDPGAATSDSDIFTLDVDGFIAGNALPRNLTNSPNAVDDDPDWSSRGDIAFTSHATTDDPVNSVTAEIWVLRADDARAPARLTTNVEEERAPAWSPDGERIVFHCRRGGPDFEICVMSADGSGVVELTDNSVGDLGAVWSSDGARILFHRNVEGRFQLWLMNADGSELVQLTDTPGLNAFASWGVRR